MRQFIATVFVVLCVGQVEAATQWAENGHYYELVDEQVTWADAKAAAEAMTFLGVGGHLVTVTTEAENDFAYSLLPELGLAWIGLTDNEAFGGYESFGQPDFKVDGWVWVTGEPVDYTCWGSFWNSAGEFVEEPNDFGGNEDYGLMGTSLESGAVAWNDQTDSLTIPYLVEYDAPVPEPSTFALLFSAAVALMAWRRRRTSR